MKNINLAKTTFDNVITIFWLLTESILGRFCKNEKKIQQILQILIVKLDFQLILFDPIVSCSRTQFRGKSSLQLVTPENWFKD